MRRKVWRPSALRKPRGSYLSFLDASGIAAVFIFLVAMYLARTPPAFDGRRIDVDYALVNHAKHMPGALRENAMVVALSRDGSLFFGNNKLAPEDLPDFIRKAAASGSKRKIYFKADARAKYGDVKGVLRQVSSSGIEDVAILVNAPR